MSDEVPATFSQRGSSLGDMPGAVLRNTVANYVNFVVLAVVGLFVNPLLLGGLGAASFGAWRATQRLLDFATVTDGRATQALKWVIAHKSGALIDDATARRDVGAAVVVWLLWLPAFLAVAAAAVVLLPAMVHQADADVGDLRVVGAILAANLALLGVIMIPDAVLVGRNAGYKSTNVTTVVVVGANIAMVIGAKNGLGLVFLATVTLTASLANSLITYLVVRRAGYWAGIDRPHRPDIVGLARLSGWTLLWQFASKLLLSTDLLLISVLLGAVAVADFTLNTYAIQMAVGVCLVTTSGLMPSLAALLGATDGARALAVATTARYVTLTLATVFGAGILLLNRSFVSTWVGPQHFLGDDVNLLTVLLFVQVALIRTDGQILDATLQIARSTIVGTTGTIVSAAFSLAMFHLGGRTIVALLLGLGLPRCFVAAEFSRRVSAHVHEARINRWHYAGAALVLAIAYALGGHINLIGWPKLVLLGTPLIVGAVALTMTIVLPEAERTHLLGRLRQAVKPRAQMS